MTKNIENRNAGGRPKNYTIDQVGDVIATMVGDGIAIEDIDAKTVKPRLCDQHGVSSGIREESLQAAVQHVLEERVEEEQRSLIAALPKTMMPAVDGILSGMRQDLLLLLGRQNAMCLSAAQQECEELRLDKRNANWRIAELEGRIESQSKAILDLEKERDAGAVEIAKIRDQLRVAQAELEHRGHETGAVDRLLAELRDPSVRDDIRAVLAEIATKPAVEPSTS